MSMNTWMGAIVPYVNDTAVISYKKESDLVRPAPANLWATLAGLKSASPGFHVACHPGEIQSRPPGAGRAGMFVIS
jgi:hypothetical protein